MSPTRRWTSKPIPDPSTSLQRLDISDITGDIGTVDPTSGVRVGVVLGRVLGIGLLLEGG